VSDMAWDKDRIKYFDNEFTHHGQRVIDEVVMQNANVHLESLDGSTYMLIMENEKQHWHININSRLGRAKVDAWMYEEYPCKRRTK